jgi:hypothetical protein
VIYMDLVSVFCRLLTSKEKHCYSPFSMMLNIGFLFWFDRYPTWGHSLFLVCQKVFMKNGWCVFLYPLRQHASLFLFLVGLGLNSGLHTCKAGALPIRFALAILEIGSHKPLAQTSFKPQSFQSQSSKKLSLQKWATGIQLTLVDS